MHAQSHSTYPITVQVEGGGGSLPLEVFLVHCIRLLTKIRQTS